MQKPHTTNHPLACRRLISYDLPMSNPSRTLTLAKIWVAIKESLNGGEQDYTRGSIPRAVFLLAIPMILELSLESVFAVVDMFFVGKLGQAAIATVGLTESVVAIIY